MLTFYLKRYLYRISSFFLEDKHVEKLLYLKIKLSINKLSIEKSIEIF